MFLAFGEDYRSSAVGKCGRGGAVEAAAAVGGDWREARDGGGVAHVNVAAAEGAREGALRGVANDADVGGEGDGGGGNREDFDAGVGGAAFASGAWAVDCGGFDGVGGDGGGFGVGCSVVAGHTSDTADGGGG